MFRTSRSLRAMATGATLALAGLGGIALAAPAGADTDQAGDEGWVRLAHFSPDTPEVDATLTAVSGDGSIELTDVGYGDVSGYSRLPEGTYSVAMVPAGAPADTEPAIATTFEVIGGGAATVAAVGLNEDLEARIIADDLTPPADDQARVRLIQASISSPEVDVLTDTGSPIAQNAPFGSATEYADVDAGRWTLEIIGTQSGMVEVDLPGGSVNTLVALDDGDELTMMVLEDASGTAQAPVGGVATGEGGLARQADQRAAVLTAGSVVIVLAVAGAGVLLVRKKTA